jgi:hypothetical protein
LPCFAEANKEAAWCGDKRASRSQESSMQVGILDVQYTNVIIMFGYLSTQYHALFRPDLHLFYSAAECPEADRSTATPRTLQEPGRQTQPNEPPDLRYLPCIMQRRILLFVYVFDVLS